MQVHDVRAHRKSWAQRKYFPFNVPRSPASIRGTACRCLRVSAPGAQYNHSRHRPRVRIRCCRDICRDRERPNFCEIKIPLPVWTLFLQRLRAVANFHPAGGVIAAQPGIVHIAEIFAFGNRAFAQSLVLDRVEQVLFASRLHPRPDQITHTNTF